MSNHPGPGYTTIGSRQMAESLEAEHHEAADAREARGHHERIKVEAYARAAQSFGVKADEMSPSQIEYAKAIERRMLGQGETMQKRGGFSLDTSGRVPNLR